jgi:hypothetical protein
MIACDGARVDVTMGENGELLDVGRRTRAIPSAIGRALWLRDGGCRVPCSSHHRMIHEGKLSAEIRDQKIVFLDQRDRPIPALPPHAATGHDLEELDQFLREADLHIDANTIPNKWDGTHVGISEILDWMFIAEQTRATTTPRPSA